VGLPGLLRQGRMPARRQPERNGERAFSLDDVHVRFMYVCPLAACSWRVSACFLLCSWSCWNARSADSPCGALPSAGSGGRTRPVDEKEFGRPDHRLLLPSSSVIILYSYVFSYYFAAATCSATALRLPALPSIGTQISEAIWNMCFWRKGTCFICFKNTTDVTIRCVWRLVWCVWRLV
jgi:hypothetical protein